MSDNTHFLRQLTKEDIFATAPMAFASKAREGLSEKYTFIPTSTIIEDLAKLGWAVCDAKSSKFRSSVNAQYGAHVIKFYNPNVKIQGSDSKDILYPNIVLINDHTGRGAFKFEVGIFRLVCSNGMVIKSKDFGSFSIKHSGYTFEELQSTVKSFVENLPDLVGVVNKMTMVELTPAQQFIFAQKAYNLRAQEERTLTKNEIESMLKARRAEDEGSSLWHVFNRIQEAVIRGGFQQINPKGKLKKAKSIRNAKRDIVINQTLWTLAEEFLPADETPALV
jgi:hypothetical protein